MALKKSPYRDVKHTLTTQVHSFITEPDENENVLFVAECGLGEQTVTHKEEQVLKQLSFLHNMANIKQKSPRFVFMLVTSKASSEDLSPECVFLEGILKKTQIPLQENFAGFGVLRIPILIEEWVAHLVPVVDTVQQRVLALNDFKETTEVRIAQLEEEVADVRTELDDYHTRFGKIEVQLRKTEEELAKMRTERDEDRTRFDELEARLSKLEQWFC